LNYTAHFASRTVTIFIRLLEQQFNGHTLATGWY